MFYFDEHKGFWNAFEKNIVFTRSAWQIPRSGTPRPTARDGLRWRAPIISSSPSRINLVRPWYRSAQACSSYEEHEMCPACHPGDALIVPARIQARLSSKETLGRWRCSMLPYLPSFMIVPCRRDPSPSAALGRRTHRLHKDDDDHHSECPVGTPAHAPTA